MNLVPFVLPTKQTNLLEELGSQNVLFPSAALMTLEQYGNYWPEPYSQVFFANIKEIVESGFFQVVAEDLGGEIDISINVWSFIGGRYSSILDISDIELDMITEMHMYFLSTN